MRFGSWLGSLPILSFISHCYELEAFHVTFELLWFGSLFFSCLFLSCGFPFFVLPLYIFEKALPLYIL